MPIRLEAMAGLISSHPKVARNFSICSAERGNSCPMPLGFDLVRGYGKREQAVVPEGLLKIAQPFKAGLDRAHAGQVPEGRQKPPVRSAVPPGLASLATSPQP